MWPTTAASAPAGCSRGVPAHGRRVADLAMALAVFRSKMVPISPLTVFSNIPYYGDFLNYTVNTKTIWEVAEENGISKEQIK